MNISTKTTGQAITNTDVLVLLTLEGKTCVLPKGIQILPFPRKSFRGKHLETRFTDAISGAAKRVLLLGLGPAGTWGAETIRRAAAIAVKKAEKTDAVSLTFWINPALAKPIGGEATLAQSLAEGVCMGNYAFNQFKSASVSTTLKRVRCHGDGRSFKPAIARGCAIGNANVFARSLQDTPGNLMRPRDMVKVARAIAAKHPRIGVTILGENEMKKRGMGSLLSVSRGSSEPAYLIHMRYRPRTRTASNRKIALVGKGLTFDAGGISLKPSAKMDEMKYDMSGGAAVLGVFHALASGIELPADLHGLVPASENLPDGNANKPGDLVTAMNGLSIEVLNTDAEGRLLLADALAYAVRDIKPDAMIDLATLTGAVVVALGHEYSGIMGNDPSLIDALLAAGKTSGELTWQLPLTETHRRMMKGTVGDLKNINSEGAGSSAGGAFLSYFVGDTPWVHCDVAGSAWDAEERDYQGGKQGTGVGVRLLLEYLQSASTIC